MIKTRNFEFNAHIGKKTVFAFISDLHETDCNPVIKIIKEIQPDAVLVVGDFIHSDTQCEKGFEFLNICGRICPVICSVGNHERLYRADLKAKVSSCGCILLDNEYMKFNGLNIGGLSSGIPSGTRRKKFKKTPPPDIEFIKEFSALPDFKILLCHHPEYYESFLKEENIDLILSGHAHGGQWRISGRGVYAPGQGIFPKYTSGIYDGKLIVSRGLGNPHKIPRINNPEDFIVLNLY